MNASESCLARPEETAFGPTAYNRMLATIGNLYCRYFHTAAISRPVNGKYTCWRCLREFGTGW
jgi:hypothetical protein